MKKYKIKTILHSKGYVSIEALIVAGLIISSGAFFVSKLAWKGKDIATSNENTMVNASKIIDNNSFNNSGTTTPGGDSTTKPQEDFTCNLENPSDLANYKYQVIDDECINNLKSKINNGNQFLPQEDEKEVELKINQLEKLKGGIILTGYHGNETNLELPSCIDNKKVVAIGSNLLQDGVSTDKPPFIPSMPPDKNYSIIIPDTVKFIHDFAFLNSNLSSVKIPNSVEYMGNSAFAFNNLNEVTLPNNITTISVSLFQKNNLTEITIPNSVTYIGNDAFGQNKLTKLDIPSSIKHLSGFESNQISDLKIPNSVEYLSGFDNNQISKLNIPSSVKYLSGFSANQLTEVTIPDSVTQIGNRAFYGNNLTSVKIGENVKSIGEEAFTCLLGPMPSTPSNQITELVIPNSVTKIGRRAFALNDISTLTLGNSLETIEENAFESNRIESLVLPSSLKYLGGFSRNRITSLTIPNGVLEIGRDAFESNDITEITIPDSVKKMEYTAFGYNKLKTVTLGKGLETVNNSFKGNYIKTVNVPQNLKDNYSNFFENPSNITFNLI